MAKWPCECQTICIAENYREGEVVQLTISLFNMLLCCHLGLRASEEMDRAIWSGKIANDAGDPR